MKIRTVKRIDPVWVNQQIGKRLRVLRHAKGYTLEQVGQGLGVSRAAVSNWELGRHQANFIIATLYNLALFYHVSAKSLLP